MKTNENSVAMPETGNVHRPLKNPNCNDGCEANSGVLPCPATVEDEENTVSDILVKDFVKQLQIGFQRIGTLKTNPDGYGEL